MQARLYGKPIVEPVVAVIGVFDPFTQMHADVMQSLVATARRQNQTAVAIVFEPDVRALLHGPERWPVMDDAPSRRRLIFATGIDRVLQITCTPDDLESGAREVFDLVAAHLPLVDLWLGHRQRLGARDSGSAEAVQHEADRHRVRVTRLPEVSILPFMDTARELLFHGRVSALCRHLSRSPQRAQAATISMAWAPGLYTALGHDALGGVTPFVISLETLAGGMRSASWPDSRFSHLSFTAGPGDAPADMVVAAD